MPIPRIRPELDFASDISRPMFVSLYRDGVEVTGFKQTFRKGLRSIAAELEDPDAAVGVHAYAVSVAGKAVTSPVLARKTG